MKIPATLEKEAVFRFYAELNDFLPPSEAGRERTYRFGGKPSVKDAIEAQGIPHTEVDLILANGDAVAFDYHPRDGDRIVVYPVFETLDITPLVRLRAAPLRKLRFVVDVNLGKLARWLRLVGMDTLYRNDLADAEIAALAADEKRVVLTRDRRLLHHGAIDHGYWLRAEDPDAQIVEVLRRFQLERSLQLFRRCLDCNGPIRAVEKDEVRERLEPKTRLHYDAFFQCEECRKVYWKGSHYERMLAKLKRVLGIGSP